MTCTPGGATVLEASGPRPGTTVVAVGSDQPTKQEIPVDVLATSKYVCDLVGQTSQIGELRSALEAGAMTAADRLKMVQKMCVAFEALKKDFGGRCALRATRRNSARNSAQFCPQFSDAASVHSGYNVGEFFQNSILPLAELLAAGAITRDVLLAPEVGGWPLGDYQQHMLAAFSRWAPTTTASTSSASTRRRGACSSATSRAPRS